MSPSGTEEPVIIEMTKHEDRHNGKNEQDRLDEGIFEILHDRYNTIAAYIFAVLVLSGLIALTTTTVLSKGIDTDTLNRFWLNQGVKYSTIAFVQFICGISAKYYRVKVNYTRKVVHIFYFVVPQLLDTELLEFDKTLYTELWNIIVILMLLILLLEPIRRRSTVFQIMFAAIDRPEDRPYTTFWFITQLLISIPIIAGFSILFTELGNKNFIFIPLLILTIGDGLAEPVGTRYGYHRYTVEGLFVNTEYTRSFEGSACVALFSVVSVMIFYTEFTKASITYCLLTLPTIMPLVEAKSPHTWDNPLILLSGYVIMVGAHYVH